MKRTKELLVVLTVCIILCGVNAGIETRGQIGKDTIGVLSYTQEDNKY